MTRFSMSCVVLTFVLAAGGCGTPPATIKNDQTVVLTADSPVYSLVVEPESKDYLLNIDATADQPVDFAFVGGNATVDEAINLRGAQIGQKQSYRKTAKTHAYEGMLAGNSRGVVLLRHDKSSGTTTVHVTRKRSPLGLKQG